MRISWAVGFSAVLVIGSLASANVITATLQVGDTDQAITLTPDVSWAGAVVNADATVSQFGQAGHIMGSVTSDSPDGDPIANSVNQVTNDTDFAWAAYIINIYMNKTFNLDAASTPLAGWNTAYVVGPALSSGPYLDQDNRPWDYMATANYYTTDPTKYIQIGGTGEFDVTFSWMGSVVYQLELIPIAPEPASLALLALGGLFLRRVRK